MKMYIAIVASIMMLATNAALGRDRATVLTGISETAAYGSVADNGIQAAWYAMDQETPGAVQMSATASAPVALIVDRGGSAMHRSGSTMHRSGSTMHRPGSSFGHLNRGHSFHSRPFGDRFHQRHQSFHGDKNRFPHRDRFFHQDRFPHRDRFFDRKHSFHRGFGHYPYSRYHYYPYGYTYPYRYYYPYGYYNYPYGYYNYANPWYFQPYPYSYFHFSW